MKLTISTVALVALATAVSAATAGVSQDRIPDAQRPGGIDAPGITLTGCVARGTATDTYTLAEAKKDATAAAATAAPAELVALAGTDVASRAGGALAERARRASATASANGRPGSARPGSGRKAMRSGAVGGRWRTSMAACSARRAAVTRR